MTDLELFQQTQNNLIATWIKAREITQDQSLTISIDSTLKINVESKHGIFHSPTLGASIHRARQMAERDRPGNAAQLRRRGEALLAEAAALEI